MALIKPLISLRPRTGDYIVSWVNKDGIAMGVITRRLMTGRSIKDEIISDKSNTSVQLKKFES